MAAVTTAVVAGGAAIAGAQSQSRAANRASRRSQRTAREQIGAEERVAEENRRLNEERYQQAQRYLAPSIFAERRAQNYLDDEIEYLSGNSRPAAFGERDFATERELGQITRGFTSFLDNPAYERILGEGVRAIDQSAASSGQLLTGNALESARDYGQQTALGFFNTYLNQRAQVKAGQDQQYANYLNILQNQANPTSSTNIANIGIGQAGTVAQQNSQSVARTNQFLGQATADANRATADIAAARSNLYGTLGGLAPSVVGGIGGAYNYFAGNTGSPVTYNPTTGTISPTR